MSAFNILHNSLKSESKHEGDSSENNVLQKINKENESVGLKSTNSKKINEKQLIDDDDDQDFVGNNLTDFISAQLNTENIDSSNQEVQSQIIDIGYQNADYKAPVDSVDEIDIHVVQNHDNGSIRDSKNFSIFPN